jgi:hypothetical protein
VEDNVDHFKARAKSLAGGLEPELSVAGNYKTAPVDNGAECIKDACFHLGQFGFHGGVLAANHGPSDTDIVFASR